MGRWVHRTTKQFLNSVSPTDAAAIDPLVNWVSEPDLSAVVGFPSKYWTITGDVISLKSQSERDVIDAAEDSVQLDQIADQLQQTRTLTRAFAEVVLDEINLLRATQSLPPRTLTQLRNAARSNL